MTYEKVTFNEELLLKGSYGDFERAHVGTVWQDRPEKTRREMLRRAWRLMERAASGKTER